MYDIGMLYWTLILIIFFYFMVFLFYSLHSKGIAAGLESMTENQVRNDRQVNPKVSQMGGQCSTILDFRCMCSDV